MNPIAMEFMNQIQQILGQYQATNQLSQGAVQMILSIINPNQLAYANQLQQTYGPQIPIAKIREYAISVIQGEATKLRQNQMYGSMPVATVGQPMNNPIVATGGFNNPGIVGGGFTSASKYEETHAPSIMPGITPAQTKDISVAPTKSNAVLEQIDTGAYLLINHAPFQCESQTKVSSRSITQKHKLVLDSDLVFQATKANENDKIALRRIEFSSPLMYNNPIVYRESMEALLTDLDSSSVDILIAIVYANTFHTLHMAKPTYETIALQFAQLNIDIVSLDVLYKIKQTILDKQAIKVYKEIEQVILQRLNSITAPAGNKTFNSLTWYKWFNSFDEVLDWAEHCINEYTVSNQHVLIKRLEFLFGYIFEPFIDNIVLDQNSLSDLRWIVMNSLHMKEHKLLTAMLDNNTDDDYKKQLFNILKGRIHLQYTDNAVFIMNDTILTNILRSLEIGELVIIQDEIPSLCIEGVCNMHSLVYVHGMSATCNFIVDSNYLVLTRLS